MSAVFVGATYVARPGCEEALRELLAPVVEATRREQGCRFYELYQSTEQPQRFLMWESWDSQEDLDLHLASPHVQDAFRRVPPLLAGEIEIRVLRA